MGECVVISDPDYNGGSPTVVGTRLTCANVVQLLRNGEDLVHYYQNAVYMSPERIRAALEYCSERRCEKQGVHAFCEHCTLSMLFQTAEEKAQYPVEDMWVAAKILLGKNNAYWNVTVDGRRVDGGG